MYPCWIKSLRVTLPLLAALTLSSCGSSPTPFSSPTPVPSPTPGSSPAPTSFAESWHFNLSSSSLTLDAALTQSVDSIVGVAHFQSYSASTPCPTFFEDLPFSGTIDAQGNASLQSSSVMGVVFSLDGLLAPDHASLSKGAYRFTGGCEDGQTGTLTGTRSRLIYGNYIGTMQLSGNTINVSADLTQASQSDSHGLFSVSGTVTLQNSCDQTYTLNGASVVGGVVHLYATTSYDLNVLDGLTGKMDPAADQIELDDYLYSDDCSAGAHGLITRQLGENR